jgi:hypothetical protein
MALLSAPDGRSEGLLIYPSLIQRVGIRADARPDRAVVEMWSRASRMFVRPRSRARPDAIRKRLRRPYRDVIKKLRSEITSSLRLKTSLTVLVRELPNLLQVFALISDSCAHNRSNAYGSAAPLHRRCVEFFVAQGTQKGYDCPA